MPERLTFLIALFIVTGLIAARLQQLFYRAVQAREPEHLDPEHAWAERVLDRSATLGREVTTGTIQRLRLLTHASPYPEAERLRRLAWVAIAAEVVVFLPFVLGWF